MNITEYIESGILEAYVLGALSTEEHTEVAANIAMYPELAEEVSAIEKAMLKYAESHAQQPPAFLQDQIWQALNNEVKAQSDTQNKIAQPVSGSATNKIVPLAPSAHKIQWQRAAIWIALVGSLATNYILLHQRDHNAQQVALIKAETDTLRLHQEKLRSLVANYEKVKDMMADTSMQTVVMHTMIKDKPMAATVYWSRQKGDTYLMVDKMPLPPQGMQYQMWVIKDGKPVDMGTISNDFIAAADGMSKLQMLVKDGQAFAISLEKEGGNPTPTQVCVLGKVAAI